jgi:hypothetical protein
VQIYDVNGNSELKKSDFLAINRTQVVWIVEDKPPTGPLNG